MLAHTHPVQYANSLSIYSNHAVYDYIVGTFIHDVSCDSNPSCFHINFIKHKYMYIISFDLQ